MRLEILRPARDSNTRIIMGGEFCDDFVDELVDSRLVSIA